MRHKLMTTHQQSEEFGDAITSRSNSSDVSGSASSPSRTRCSALAISSASNRSSSFFSFLLRCVFNFFGFPASTSALASVSPLSSSSVVHYVVCAALALLFSWIGSACSVCVVIVVWEAMRSQFGLRAAPTRNLSNLG